MSYTTLENSLRSTLYDIQAQIQVVVDDAKRLGVDAAGMRHIDGTYVLTPLLLAKAQTLNGLALLKSQK